jgi:hypothetical protein
MPFTGGGRRLDGKAPKTSPSASTGAAAAAAARAGATSAPPRTSSEGASAAAPAEAPRRASGKLVFGAGGGSAGPKVSLLTIFFMSFSFLGVAENSVSLYCQVHKVEACIVMQGTMMKCLEDMSWFEVLSEEWKFVVWAKERANDSWIY